MVWKKRIQTRRKIEFHSSKDDTDLPGDQVPCLHKYQCLESWNSASDERENFHTLQR